MQPRHRQSDGGADHAPQLWLAVPERGMNDSGSSWPRKARREIERAASLALLANTDAPTMPRRSLSHSGGCAAIAIAPAGCLAGVDIEVTMPRDVRSIAQFAFAPDEARELRSLAEPEAIARFYILWTVKEAFAKALGMPLLAALRNVSFALHDGCWSARVPPVAPWRAEVFAPRPTLTLAAVIIGPRDAMLDDWICREWPGTVEGSWRCLATLAGGDHGRQL
jgi:4'-phosphopantetheinyl transferase